MKKKKWGEEEEKEITNEYRNKLEKAASNNLLSKFSPEFDSIANY
jgi:hypothetical protein